jgi:hypothetical protein
MKFVKREEHQVTRIFTYDISDETIEEGFSSVERFVELAKHFSGQEDDLPFWEEPTIEESERFHELIAEQDFDHYDDWWTDRKGSYSVSYEIGEE